MRRRIRKLKIINTKISAEGLMAIYTKFCTYENIPLYGITSIGPYCMQCSEFNMWVMGTPTSSMLDCSL